MPRPADDILVVPRFASEPEVRAISAALDATVRYHVDGKASRDIRVLNVRTEVPGRAVVRSCPGDDSEQLTNVRERAIRAVKEFFDLREQWPELTLLSEMRPTDRHPLHADAERQVTGG